MRTKKEDAERGTRAWSDGNHLNHFFDFRGIVKWPISFMFAVKIIDLSRTFYLNTRSTCLGRQTLFLVYYRRQPLIKKFSLLPAPCFIIRQYFVFNKLRTSEHRDRQLKISSEGSSQSGYFCVPTWHLVRLCANFDGNLFLSPGLTWFTSIFIWLLFKRKSKFDAKRRLEERNIPMMKPDFHL